MFDMATIKDFLQIMADIATIAGIPIAILIFYNEKRRERLDREWGTYNSLDDKYTDFLKLCLNYPEYEYFEVMEKGKTLTEAERKQMILYTIEMTQNEKAFLMYKDQSSDLKRRQWEGWVEDIRHYCTFEKFRRTWKETRASAGWDTDFTKFMNSLIDEEET